MTSYTVHLKSTAGETWARERVRVVVEAACEGAAAMLAKERARESYRDRPVGCWYAERVEEC